jgi:hypothetical protein
MGGSASFSEGTGVEVGWRHHGFDAGNEIHNDPGRIALDRHR